MKTRNLLSTLSVLALTVLVLAGCKPNHKATAVTYQLPETADVVLYQVNPRVFASSNSLRAVTERLDSIQEMGANMIWIMPIYPIGEEKSKNSPYSIRDYKAIAPEFGTIDDLKELIEGAHERGMGVILDWVANHTAWDNVWLKDQGHTDWYTHDSLGNIVYPPQTDWTDVADLNYDNKDMRAAMIDAMKYWVKEVGVDGFRCDVADAVPADFWKEAISQLRKAAGSRKLLMLAEGKNPDNFTAGFNMNYAWDYLHELEEVFSHGARADVLFTADSTEYASIPRGKMKMRFTTNHDESAKNSPITNFGNERGSMAAFVAAIMMHGGPLIYGSQEVGYPRPINFFNYVNVDWSAKPELRDEYRMLMGIYNHYVDLFNINAEVIAHPDKDILMIERRNRTSEALVLVNVRKEHHEIELPTNWRNSTPTDVCTGNVDAIATQLNLQPYQYRILVKSR